jgi:3-hydroxyisobutyrate dehydrogenase
MASNLASAGFALALWNRNADKAEQLAASISAATCETPRQLAEASEVVITMLADDRASAEVHRGVDGLFAADGGAEHFLVMGTHSPGHVGQLVEAAAGRIVIDAPVSGSIDAAREARLMIMVGATETTISPVKPVLAAMGREIICFGRSGTGATMKLAVNLLIHGLNQTLAESLTLVEAAGIDPADAYWAMEKSAAAAPMLHYRKLQYLDETASPVSFALSLARKDVALALDLAQDLAVPMPQARLNLDQLQAAESEGFGDRDMASMLHYLRGIR